MPVVDSVHANACQSQSNLVSSSQLANADAKVRYTMFGEKNIAHGVVGKLNTLIADLSNDNRPGRKTQSLRATLVTPSPAVGHGGSAQSGVG